MERVRMLSQARAELFTLFEEVTSHAGRKVILRHRGSDRDAVLVSRDYLRRLEQARADATAGPFSLIGSAKLQQPVEDALALLRREAEASFERKLLTAKDEGSVQQKVAVSARGRTRAARRATGSGKRR